MNTTINEPETYTGTPQSATLHTITLNKDASDQDGAYTEHVLKHIKGTGIGEQQTIKSYNGRTRVATLHGTWNIIPDATSVYTIINPEPTEFSASITPKADPDLKTQFESLKEIHGMTFSDALEIGMKEVIHKVHNPRMKSGARSMRKRQNSKTYTLSCILSRKHKDTPKWMKWISGLIEMSNKQKFDNIFKYLGEKKKEQWLIHIKTDRETPGLTFDIEKYGIYYDSTEGNYRRKLQCECGADLGCFCFGSLAGAIESVDCTLVICDRCYLKEIDGEEADSIQSIMHDLCPDKTVDQMNDFEVERIMRFTREQHNDDYNEMDMEVCGV